MCTDLTRVGQRDFLENGTFCVETRKFSDKSGEWGDEAGSHCPLSQNLPRHWPGKLGFWVYSPEGGRGSLKSCPVAMTRLLRSVVKEGFQSLFRHTQTAKENQPGIFISWLLSHVHPCCGWQRVASTGWVSCLYFLLVGRKVSSLISSSGLGEGCPFVCLGHCRPMRLRTPWPSDKVHM